MKKLRITKCTPLDSWYADRIGEVFPIIEFLLGAYLDKDRIYQPCRVPKVQACPKHTNIVDLRDCVLILPATIKRSTQLRG